MTTSRAGARRGSRGMPQRSRGQKRELVWQDRLVNLAMAQNATQTLDLTLNLANDERKGMTLVRTIISLDFNSRTAGAGNHIRMGIYKADGDAMAALALPDPGTETDNPGWIFRDSLFLSTTAANDGSQGRQIHADVRAQRKLLAESDVVAMIFETAGVAITIDIDGLVRTLWKRS